MHMNLLYNLLKETTGKIYSDKGLDVSKEEYEIIDCVLVKIVVHKKKALERKGQLISLLKQYPYPETLRDGPSYIAVGAEIGDQGATFQLFALGSFLNIWKLVTPVTLGMEGEEAKKAAGTGWIIITGFKKEHWYGY